MSEAESRPETSFETKQAMMRAEHGDEVRVESLGVCEVVQRVNTYYGPKIRVEPVEDADSDQYLLHASGPRSEAQLSTTGCEPLREVQVEIVGTKQYDICLQCGEPLKTVEHRRRAAIGACVPDSGGETDA